MWALAQDPYCPLFGLKRYVPSFESVKVAKAPAPMLSVERITSGASARLDGAEWLRDKQEQTAAQLRLEGLRMGLFLRGR